MNTIKENGNYIILVKHRKLLRGRFFFLFFFFFMGGGGGGDVVRDHSTGLQRGKVWGGGCAVRSHLTGIGYIPRWILKKILKLSRAMSGILGSVITEYVIYKPSTVL